jgi:hypothetical protein
MTMGQSIRGLWGLKVAFISGPKTTVTQKVFKLFVEAIN